jgi:hypothetical protein
MLSAAAASARFDWPNTSTAEGGTPFADSRARRWGDRQRARSEAAASQLGHAAFVVPVAFGPYRVGVDATRLAADRATMRLMVLATRETFTAVQETGNNQIPTNLRILYCLPTVFVVAYWRRVLASPRGELWFGAHSRAAPEGMRSMAQELQDALRRTARTERPTPNPDRLLTQI